MATQRKYLADLDMNNNEVKNVVIDKQATAPTAITAGRIVYVTADNTLRYGDGTTYKAVATTTDLGEYAKLVDGKVPMDLLITSGAVDRVVVIDGATTITAGQTLVMGEDGTVVGSTPATVYTPKGSVATYDALPTDAKAGDVYNVEAQFTIDGKVYPAGTNVAYTDAGAWDPLGGIVDLSAYATTSYVDTEVAKVQADVDTKVTALETKPTAGTYTKVTINGEGLVTAGATLSASDIPDISATYILVSQKGVANGVATLDASGIIPIEQIPTGNEADKVVKLASAGTAGQLIAVNSTADGFTFVDPSTMKKVTKSAVTFTLSDDVYVATIAHGLTGYPASVTVLDSNGVEIYVNVKLDTANVTLTANQDPGSVTVVIIG